MTKRTFSNTHPRREAAEKDGIALMLSGSYVLTSLNQDEFDRLRRTALSSIHFVDTPSVVVTNAYSKAKRGSLAHIGHLSVDGRFVRYRHPIFPSRTSVITLKLIKGTAYPIADFQALVRSNETLHVRRQQDWREFTGILIGSDQHKYSSLLIPSGNAPGFDFLDIETESNPHNAGVIVSVIARNPVPAHQFLLSLATPNPNTRNS